MSILLSGLDEVFTSSIVPPFLCEKDPLSAQGMQLTNRITNARNDAIIFFTPIKLLNLAR